jgi:MFS family permease
VPRIIRRVGHIRAFGSGVAVATIALVLAGLQPDFFLWLILRFLTGCSLAALYTVVESWLNEQSSNQTRGSLLAVYTTISLGAMAAGQLFVEINRFSFEELFGIAAVLLIAATLPIGLTTNPQPTAPADVSIDWRLAYRASHVGVVCAGLSGMVVGLLWSMGAIYASDLVGSIEAGSRFVMFAILGGFICQFPAGRLSDYFDRRVIILALTAIGASGAGFTLLTPPENEQLLYLSAFLCGAGAMPMYSICVAHANDNANGSFLQIASAMLITNAVGSIVGPFLFAGADFLGFENGFMMTIMLAFVACAVWTLLRMGTHTVMRKHYEPYQPLPKTTTEAITLDPRMRDSDQLTVPANPTNKETQQS